MTTKLQKIERPRQNPSRGTPQARVVQPTTQAIIINNPNIKVNYLNDSNKNKGPLSSRGLETWNLNNNLKQFSQTRQLGFFKHKNERNKSNSPYIIHKVRTQDLKTINKLYTPSNPSPLNSTLSGFRKNQTITHIPQPSMAEPSISNTQAPNPLEKLLIRHEKTVTQKFYQGRMKKQVAKDYETLPTHFINMTNPELSAPKTFRRDRFQLAQPQAPLTQRKVETGDSKETTNSPQKYRKVEDKGEDKEEAINESEEFDTKVQRQVAPRMVPLQLRRKAFSKTIAKIDQALLRNTDDYFQRFHTYKLPQTQIELLVNSVSHPEPVLDESRVQAQPEAGWGLYEFEFEQERKKRPRTPKRKKQDHQDES